MASFTPIPLDRAETIARYSLIPDDASLQIEIAQVEHRLQLINTWRMLPGSKILEIGCGQGTCTAVLAAAIGPDGHVDAVDPAPLDYGKPYTVAEAQAHLSAGEMGSRITWHHAEPSDVLLAAPDKQWDYAVLCHCIWYLDNRQVLADMLRAFNGRVRSVLVAEYALKATERDAEPHLLAAITRASLEAEHPRIAANIRCLFSPTSIKETAEAAGWIVGSEHNVIPTEGLSDGTWETSGVRSKDFIDEVEERISLPRFKEAILSSREAVIAAYTALDGRKIRTMDVWVTSLNQHSANTG